MKRIPPLLLAILALILAACGSDQTDVTASPSPVATPTLAPTPAPTPSPTASETATSDPTDGGEITGELSELLPDDVQGLQRSELDSGFERMMEDALARQAGLAGQDVEVSYAQYGSGELTVIGMRLPGLPEGDFEMLARMMAGATPTGPDGEEVESAAETVGGKDVLRMSMEGEAEVVYVYRVGDAFFTVVAQSEDLAAELLQQLP